MKATLPVMKAIIEHCLKNAGQCLHIILFTVLLNILPIGDGGTLLASISLSDAAANENKRNEDVYKSTPAVSFQEVQDNVTQPTIEWDKTIGGSDFDYLRSAILTPDGGYLLAGTSDSNISGDKSANNKGFGDYWIVKIDDQGNKIWDKTIGGSGIETFYNVIPSPDGGYLLAGESGSDASGDKSENGKGGGDYWVVKIDDQGNKQWDKTFGGSSHDGLRSTISTIDGGYLLAGVSLSNTSGDKSEDSKGHYDTWVVKIDNQGNKQWDKTFGGSRNDDIASAISTPDGGYLLAGSSDSPASGDKSENPKGGYDYWIVKIDAEGNKIWDKIIGGSGYDQHPDVISTPDGGYLLAGTSGSDASGDKSENSKGGEDYWVVKIDDQGNKIWDKTLGGSSYDFLQSIIPITEGGYLLAGSSNSNISGDKSENSKGTYDYWIIKVDAQGNKVWDKTLGEKKHDWPGSAILTSNGGYLLAGYSDSPASGDKSENSKGLSDYWIVKLKEQKEQTTPVVTSLTLIDAVTDQEIKELKDGDVISLAEVGNRLLNIRANISDFVDHVDLKLKGVVSYSRTEKVFPYALFGDIEGDYEGQALQAGKYKLTITPYTKDEKGPTFTISFHVIEGIAEKPMIEWDKTFGGSNTDELHSALSTLDGGYLLGGTSWSNASGDKSENGKNKGRTDYWIVKIDDQGNKQWDKTLGGNFNDNLSNVILSPDGGYLLAGFSESDASEDKSENSKGGRDYWIVKIDAQGNKIWDKTIGGSSSDELSSAVLTPDGGYLLAGTSLSTASGDKSENSKGGRDYWIVKIDAQGNKIWDKTLGGNWVDHLSSALSTPDGGYLLSGTSWSDASGDKSEESRGFWDYWVVKIDTQGNKVWDKTFGGNREDHLNRAIFTSDGGYLLAGDSDSPASGDKSDDSKGGFDCWVVKIDAGGNKVWDKTIEGSGGDIISTPDGGYLLAGTSSSWDYRIVKINAEGNKIWDKTLEGNYADWLSKAIYTNDDGYLLAGYSVSDASGDKSENSKGGIDYWVVKLKEPTTPVVTNLTLIDAETDQEIKELKEGDVISLAEVGNRLLNIHANLSGLTDLVELKLQGPIKHRRIELVSPYTLFGNMEGDYEGKQLRPGSYTLTVTPYKGITHTVSFEVIDAPEATVRQVRIYPVPTSDMINIIYEGRSEEAQLMLLDFGGNILLQEPLGQQLMEQLNLSGFRKGIYYLKVISPERVQVFRVVKE